MDPNEGHFDACIDFDKVMRNPLDTTRLVSSYQNDGLHPDAAGYKTMGESIDHILFTGADTVFQREREQSRSGLRLNAFRPLVASSTQSMMLQRQMANT